MSILSKDLSIIIPIYSGETSHLTLISDLSNLAGESEVILAAATEEDKNQIFPIKIHWLKCELGRAKQLNKAAYCAERSNLLFLHADTRMTQKAFDKLLKEYDVNALNYFDLKFATANPLLRLNEWGVAIRSRILSVPFGDQGFCLSKKTFQRLGGFDEKTPFGEDHLFVWKARKHQVLVRPLKASLTTSARKYEKNGWGKTTLSHVYWTVKQALLANKEKN